MYYRQLPKVKSSMHHKGIRRMHKCTVHCTVHSRETTPVVSIFLQRPNVPGLFSHRTHKASTIANLHIHFYIHNYWHLLLNIRSAAKKKLNWPSLDSIDLQHTQNRMVMKNSFTQVPKCPALQCNEQQKFIIISYSAMYFVTLYKYH